MEGATDWKASTSQIHLDAGANAADLRSSSSRGLAMSRECSITGARPAKGHVIHRRGMAKKKGGVGQHITANTPRAFTPNLKTKRIWVPELNRFVTVKLSARALKTITKNGALKTLKKAGLV
jgi:large subunit ribosomal protein L28